MFGTLLGIDIMGGGASAPDNMPDYSFIGNNIVQIITGILIVSLTTLAIIYLIKSGFFKTKNENDDIPHNNTEERD